MNRRNLKYTKSFRSFKIREAQAVSEKEQSEQCLLNAETLRQTIINLTVNKEK
jgi:hypothetical protein